MDEFHRKMLTLIFINNMKTILIALAFFSARTDYTAVNSTVVIEQGLQQVKRVSKDEFKKFLSEHKKVQLIDVRTPGEFAEGTIEGAKNIDFYDATFKDQISKLDKNVPTLIFCRSGGRSAKALEMFKAAGFSTVLELEGGYLNWVK